MQHLWQDPSFVITHLLLYNKHKLLVQLPFCWFFVICFVCLWKKQINLALELYMEIREYKTDRLFKDCVNPEIYRMYHFHLAVLTCIILELLWYIFEYKSRNESSYTWDIFGGDLKRSVIKRAIINKPRKITSFNTLTCNIIWIK